MLESCASLSTRCHKCDGMTNGERFYFIISLNKQRLYTLIKGICKFHPRSQYSMFLWDKINGNDSMDEELIAKLMFGVGRSRVDRPAFNLFAGCHTQWAFFQTCTLLDPVPDFALPTMLSRSLSEQHSLSWKKVILKLSEALQDTMLSDVGMLRAMLNFDHAGNGRSEFVWLGETKVTRGNNCVRKSFFVSSLARESGQQAAYCSF